MRRLAFLACLIALPSLAAHSTGPDTPDARAEAREDGVTGNVLSEKRVGADRVVHGLA